MAIWEKLKVWTDKPFNAEGDIVSWFLFVGLLILTAWFWSRVVARIGV